MQNYLEQLEHNGWCLPEKVGFLVQIGLYLTLHTTRHLHKLKMPRPHCKQRTTGLAAQGLHPLAEEAVRASRRIYACIYASVRKTRLQPCAWLGQPGGGKVLLKLESEQARDLFKRRCIGVHACTREVLVCNVEA